MVATNVGGSVPHPFAPPVSTISLPPSQLDIERPYRCLRTLCSQEILLTNTWLRKPTEILVHTFLTGPPTRRRPATLPVAPRHPLSQRSSQLCSAFLGLPNNYQEQSSVPLHIPLITTSPGTILPAAQRTITSRTELSQRHAFVQLRPGQVGL